MSSDAAFISGHTLENPKKCATLSHFFSGTIPFWAAIIAPHLVPSSSHPIRKAPFRRQKPRGARAQANARRFLPVFHYLRWAFLRHPSWSSHNSTRCSMSKEELPSSQHDQLATAIVRGKSNAGWARQIGVPGRTAQRWATEPMSAARLRAADQRIRQIERIDPSAGAAKRTKPRSASRCAFQFRRRVGKLSHRKRFGRLCRRCQDFQVPPRS